MKTFMGLVGAVFTITVFYHAVIGDMKKDVWDIVRLRTDGEPQKPTEMMNQIMDKFRWRVGVAIFGGVASYAMFESIKAGI